ncbi:hypothetical protein ETAA8_68440 [Anatilimnocola aggregata]|uniref:Uncharacterized protein n=1 Tax=Anatilimnocola aggregata TaxID=2528021 RepID=A0A517YN90_9BACT|nr:hypothetical protein ETAA8_68440 [Anatilimnocola aggregata]
MANLEAIRSVLRELESSRHDVEVALTPRESEGTLLYASTELSTVPVECSRSFSLPQFDRPSG